MNRVLGLVTARGGSKGIPGKNISPLAGKPLIAWTLEAASASRSLDRIVVSTDDDEIAEVCREWGMEVPFQRPAQLAKDDSSHIGVVLHALEWLAANDGYRPDSVMLLQPTSPLRTADDIDAAASIMVEKNAPAVLSVCSTHDHPFLVRAITDGGTLANFVESDLEYARRQALPGAFAINGAIYLNRRESLIADRSFEPAGTIPYVMPPDRSLQIDTPWDLHLCELVLRDRGKSLDPFILHGDEQAGFGAAYDNATDSQAALQRLSTR